MTKIETSTSSIPLGLNGQPTLKNRGAIAWSLDNLVAVGCNTEILIIDGITLELLQIFDTFHKSSVNRVLWNPFSRELKPEKSTGLDHPDLISADVTSIISIWNIQKSTPIHTFLPPENRILLQMRWVPTGPESLKRSKMVLLYGGNYVVLFDLYSLLHQSFVVDAPGEEFHDFDLNPFQEKACLELGFLSQNSILGLLSNWDPLKNTKDRLPLSDKIPLNFGGNKTENPAQNPENPEPRKFEMKKSASSSGSIRKLMSDIVGGGGGGGENSSSSHLGLSYDPNYPQTSIYFHPNIRDSVLIANSTKISLVNIRFRTLLSTISLDKNQSILSVLPISSGPALFTLHESGVISLRKFTFVGSHNISLNLEPICNSDNPRFPKKSQVLSATLDPLNESRVLLHCIDGRLITYELYHPKSKENYQEECKGPGKKILPTPVDPSIHMNAFAVSSSPQKLPSETSASQLLPFDQLVRSSILVDGCENLRFRLKKIVNHISSLTCLKLAPNGKTLLAGTVNGFLLVVEIDEFSRGRIVRRFSVHANNPVAGIEFISDREALTWSNLSFSANPKNELILTEIESGASLILKQDASFHITSIKVSPLRQYFVLIFKNGLSPSELWDIPRRQLIKTLPTKLPPISCITWKEKVNDSREETFYMTDLGSYLFTFRVEGNRFSSATCTKLLENSQGIPMSLFTIGSLVYRADSSGSLVIYNTEKKTASSHLPIGRGPLHKVDHLGDQFVALFNDYIELWDASAVKKIRTIHGIAQDKIVRASDLAIMNKYNVVAYISKSSGSLKFLPLDLEKTKGLSQFQFSLANYPVYLTPKEKALQLYRILKEPSENPGEEIEGLFRGFGMWEEARFLSVFIKALTPYVDSSNTKNVGIWLGDKEADFAEISYKTALAAWVADFSKREEVARALIFAGEMDKAAEILLDSEPSDPKVYLLNGLMSSITMGHASLPEPTKAILKITSTNLIASGEIEEGLQLLCILSKHSEACKYLEGSNDWGKALIIARSSLLKEPLPVLEKYANYLNSYRIIFKSASIFAAIGRVERAIEVIFGARKRHLAYISLFLAERGAVASLGSIGEHIKLAISLDFARFLFETGCVKESVEFCERIGAGAEDLKSEIEILSS